MIDAVDITDFLPTHDITIEIISPNGKPTGWKWTLAATSHEKNAAYLEAQASRNLERSKVLREAQFNGVRYEAEKKSPEESRREDAQWIVARVLDWTPIKIKDETYTFSDEATEHLLIRPEMNFALAQVVKALNDDARFTKRSVAP